MNDIKVSIMIPAYNVEEYIERCMRSAMQQTMQEIEIIVVDDGSTDKTSQIIATLAEEDSRIVVIEKENGGLPSARNASLDVARGKYIQTLDGDDWIEPTACEELYSYAEENDLDMVVADYYIDDDNGNIVEKQVFHGATSVLGRVESLERTFVESDSGMLCNRFVKRDLYGNLRLPLHISYGEDLVTSSRLAIKANRTAKYNKAFYHYIYNPSSITKDAVGKKMHQYFEGFKIIRKYLSDADLLENVEKYLEVLEFNKVAFFMFQDVYMKDENYKRSLDMVLEYVKIHKIIPTELTRTRKLFVQSLSLWPTKINFLFLSFIARLLRKVRG